MKLILFIRHSKQARNHAYNKVPEIHVQFEPEADMVSELVKILINTENNSKDARLE